MGLQWNSLITSSQTARLLKLVVGIRETDHHIYEENLPYETNSLTPSQIIKEDSTRNDNIIREDSIKFLLPYSAYNEAIYKRLTALVMFREKFDT